MHMLEIMSEIHIWSILCSVNQFFLFFLNFACLFQISIVLHNYIT